VSRATRWALVAGATLAVGIAIVGVFVPLLPTTPFLLLAALLAARGSPRFHRFLLGRRWIGAYLRRYVEQRSMTRRHKVVTLLLLWVGLAITAWRLAATGWMRAILAAVGVGVSAHLLWIPAAKDDTT